MDQREQKRRMVIGLRVKIVKNPTWYQDLGKSYGWWFLTSRSSIDLGPLKWVAISRTVVLWFLAETGISCCQASLV